MSGTARRLPWLALVALFVVPGAIWALSSPLYSVPDEPDQAVKAVSIWYGQLGGSPLAAPGSPGAPRRQIVGNWLVRTYRVPELWATSTNPAVCYAFRPDVTPDECDDRLFEGGRQLGEVDTYNAAFPPLYFALVGWGGRLFPGSTGVYVMRLTSALLSAVLLAAAVRALQRVVRVPLVLLGVLAAATPMTWFLAGAVNANGLEITAAIALWCHLLAVVLGPERGGPDAPVARSLLVGVVLCGGVLAFTRQISPLYVGLVVVFAASVGSWTTLRSLGRERSVQIAFGVLAGASLVAFALVLGSHSLTSLGGGPLPEGVNPWLAILGQTEQHVHEMIGWFGWLDTPPSSLVTTLWLAVLAMLVGAAVALNHVRRLWGLASTIVVTVALPVVLQAPRSGDEVLTWQGRHGLAVAVGIPLLAVALVDRPSGPLGEPVRRLAVLGVVLVVVADVAALWWNLHRYTVGLTSHSLDVGAGAWQPPLGSWVWVGAMAAWGAAVVAITAMVGRRRGEGWTTRGERRSDPVGSPLAMRSRSGAANG